MPALVVGVRMALRKSFSLFIRLISYSSQLRILPGAGQAHRVIFTQNDVRDFGCNRREFYTGSQGRFGWQNESSNRQQRVAKNVHYVSAVAVAKRAMFLPISIQRVCIRKLQNNH
jgi:hypothetical protein